MQLGPVWGGAAFVAWTVLVIVAIEGSNWTVTTIPQWFGAAQLPQRKPIISYTRTDRLYVLISKLVTAVWVYNFVQFSRLSSRVLWNLHDVTLSSVPLALVLLFAVYDFLYYFCHRAAHSGLLYRYIHRHHHRLLFPVRGNDDGINVHPLEIVVSEYLHLAAAAIVSYWILGRSGVHVIALILFVAISGLLSGLSHTRHDVGFPLFPSLWKVRYHQIHHSDRDVNFGQYFMIWDYLFGTYRPKPQLRV